LNVKTALVMATQLEAAPFIGMLSLTRLEEKPFRLYSGKDHLLVLSGIGKSRAAMATALLAQRFNPSILLNLGAAGAFSMNFSVGDIVHIDHVLEPDRPELFSGKERVLIPDILPGFRNAALATQDRAVVDPEERKRFSKMADLADMEGAGFLQACRIMGAGRAYLFKIVTDTPEHDSDSAIVENVRSTAGILSVFYHDRIMPLLASME